MQEFSLEKKIYYHDTDCGGVVYYANYLKYLEEGRTEYVLSKGVNLQEWFGRGLAFVVVHVELDYKAPAKYQDAIKIITSIEKIGNTSIHFNQEIKKEASLLVTSKTIWACIDKDFKPCNVPAEIRQALSGA